ncbi:MAG: type II toxin-antitoxin system Phd/YefM family antitoxin [Ruminococcaceae bacterium]|nr:type II toxin-antitoxin system Phd/YefM family antitoxin [Oscillospiraceae bacterium]
MNISSKAIVSNSDMIKNYKACREKAQTNGKILILKNNQPDAVLFSIDEYERLSVFIEYMESMEDKDIARITALLPVEGKRKTYTFDHLMHDIDVGQPDVGQPQE